jgi:DNA-binding transcriptional regulator GbsR (MarR family)
MIFRRLEVYRYLGIRKTIGLIYSRLYLSKDLVYSLYIYESRIYISYFSSNTERY